MAQMTIPNLIRFTMNYTNFSKNILFCCGIGCHANLPHRKVETSKGWQLRDCITIYFVKSHIFWRRGYVISHFCLSVLLCNVCFYGKFAPKIVNGIKRKLLNIIFFCTLLCAGCLWNVQPIFHLSQPGAEGGYRNFENFLEGINFVSMFDIGGRETLFVHYVVCHAWLQLTSYYTRVTQLPTTGIHL